MSAIFGLLIKKRMLSSRIGLALMLCGATLTSIVEAPAVRGQVPPTQPARELAVIGHTDIGGRGFNGDVYSLGNFAYVGSWGRDPRTGIPCPADGVSVIDISDPSAPDPVSILKNPKLTTAEDVVVVHAETQQFTGDLAVVGIQACGFRRPVFRGLMLYDVTDPTHPTKLGRWRSPGLTHGCHEIDVATPGDRVIVACANPYAETHGKDGVILVNASNPNRPKKVGGFNLLDRDSSPPVVGCFKAWYAHSVRFAHGIKDLYVSYWDAGTMHFKIRKGMRFRLIGTRRISPRDEDGDNHSMSLASGGDLMIINPEDLSPDTRSGGFGCKGKTWGGWGEMYIYDNSDPRKTRFLAKFSTANSRTRRNAGIYTIHNTEVVSGNQVFASWYSDGVIWIDISAPKKPTKVDRFVPEAAQDPHGYWPTQPMVWGVRPYPQGDLILASDINSGLWILQPVGLTNF